MIRTRVRGHALRTVGVCGALLVGLGCPQEPPPDASDAPVARPAKVSEAARDASTTRREYAGRISPATNVELGFGVAGRLVELPVVEGQHVAAGTVIARLDPRELEADLDAAHANATAAGAEYERRQKLLQDEILSPRDVERGRRNLEIMKANVAVRQRMLDDTVLRAPFDGTIARRIANDFEDVAAKQAIVVLQPRSALEIVVDVPARHFTGLSMEERKEAIDARVVVPAIADLELPARLKELAAVDPRTRTVRATFSFDRPSDVDVQPGTAAKLVVDIDGSS